MLRRARRATQAPLITAVAATSIERPASRWTVKPSIDVAAAIASDVPIAIPAPRSRGIRSGGHARPGRRLGARIRGARPAPGGVSGAEHDQREAGDQRAAAHGAARRGPEEQPRHGVPSDSPIARPKGLATAAIWLGVQRAVEPLELPAQSAADLLAELEDALVGDR